jgi:hypothetical protein
MFRVKAIVTQLPNIHKSPIGIRELHGKCPYRGAGKLSVFGIAPLPSLISHLEKQSI